MTRLDIPDMNCGHCKASVEAALAGVPGTATVTVDLPARTVDVAGDTPATALIAALAAVGFDARVKTG